MVKNRRFYSVCAKQPSDRTSKMPETDNNDFLFLNGTVFILIDRIGVVEFRLQKFLVDEKKKRRNAHGNGGDGQKLRIQLRAQQINIG